MTSDEASCPCGLTSRLWTRGTKYYVSKGMEDSTYPSVNLGARIWKLKGTKKAQEVCSDVAVCCAEITLGLRSIWQLILDACTYSLGRHPGQSDLAPLLRLN